LNIDGIMDVFLVGVGVGAIVGVVLCRLIYLRGVKDGRGKQ